MRRIAMLAGAGYVVAAAVALVVGEARARHRLEVGAWRLIALRHEAECNELRSRIGYLEPAARAGSDFGGCVL